MSVSIGGSTVTEEDANLVDGFGSLTQEVPKHVHVFTVGLRISLLSVDKVGEL